MIEPVLVIAPVKPPSARRPTALLILVKPIWPALLTELLLLIVTAVPGAVTPIDPLPEMMISAGLPLLTVAVETGVLVDVEIVTCAKAGPDTAMRGPSETAAARNLRFISENSQLAGV